MSRPKKHRPAPSSRSPRHQSSRKQESKSRRFGTAAWVAVAVALVVGTLVTLALAEEGPASVERDPAVVAAGEALYVDSCAVCHGADLRGSSTGPPLLVPTYAPNHHADEAFQRAVAFGVQPHHWNFGPMLPVEGLDRDDVSRIITYVRSVQEAEGIFRDPTHP